MQAVNHVAAALILKRTVPSAPLLGLMVATEAVEVLWVGLNIMGVEWITIDEGATDLTGLHLAHMPWSHSIVMSFLFGALTFFGLRARLGVAVAGALAAAVLSHIVLDLATHAPDIALAPFIPDPKYGSGLMAWSPLVTLGLETAFGLWCWKVFGGGKALFAVMIFFAVVALPSYLPNSSALDAMTPESFPLLILFQIVLTIGLMWGLGKDTK